MSDALVVDASVAIKWSLGEPDSELALRVVRLRLLAPAFMLLECGSAIWRHVQLGEVDRSQAGQALEVIRTMPVQLCPIEGLVERALELAIMLSHPIYDCVYLALALDRGTRVVTADRRFLRAARRERVLATAVVALSEMAH